MHIHQQIAVVTGGASGMGRACALALKKAGARVVIWDRQILNTEEDFYAIACDVSSESSIEQAIEETMQKVGIPSICINCAGIAPAKRMVGKDGAMPLNDFKHVIDINLVGTFNVMRVVAAAMMDRTLDGTEERGVIINTASIAAYEGQIGQLAYSASKGGIVAMTLPAARELAQHAIRVNTIAPGLMATPLLPPSLREQLAKTVTYPQRLGHPNEFAVLVLHLIENQYLNGEVIRLDGALRMMAR